MNYESEKGILNKREKEFSPETLKKFEALIVLGKGWREGYPPKKKSKQWQPRLSIESKMSALAAGEMFESGLIDKIIFSTGRTAGEDWPSEAGAMCKYTKKNYPEIPEEAIILEEESIDTAENAEKVGFILEKNSLSNVILLSVGFHLPRAEKLFKEYGIEVRSFPSEELLKKRSPHYQGFVEKYSKSSRVKAEKIKEFILKSLLVIDAKGRIPRMVTKKRGQ